MIGSPFCCVMIPFATTVDCACTLFMNKIIEINKNSKCDLVFAKQEMQYFILRIARRVNDLIMAFLIYEQ
jgi:hypothetical protein